MKEKTAAGVVFIGAGPGDAGLITVKGQQLLAEADLVLYAGSLVSPEVLNYTRNGAERVNSAGMKLEEQIDLMVSAVRQGKRVVRLHTGDPSIFGAVDEQMSALAAAGVWYEVIPGVSSAFAAAAALGIEFTLPEITQTLVLTRAGGRTPVPEAERLRELARHHSSLAIFLSTGMMATVVDELRAVGYPLETPAAVVYRASWPDQQVVRGTLADIVSRVEEAELTHQGIIIISPALKAERHTPSHLYSGFQNGNAPRAGMAIIGITRPSIQLGRRLNRHFPETHLFIPRRFMLGDEAGNPYIHGFQESIRQVLQGAFRLYDSLVCIMACGIAVRELGPLINNKHSDPGVVVMDPDGKFVVSLLSGHEGGANRLAVQIAALTGGQAVITTGSDNRGIPALDILARENGWNQHPKSRLAQVMAALVNDEPVALVRDRDLSLTTGVDDLPWAAVFDRWQDAVLAGYRRLVVVTCREIPAAFWDDAPVSVVYHPPALVLGVGCKYGMKADEIQTAINSTLSDNGLALESVFCLATIEDKAGEPGLITVCSTMDWEQRAFSREAIGDVPDLPNPSDKVHKVLGVKGVAEPAAMLAAGTDRLLVEKKKFAGVTVAVALRREAP